VTHQRRSDYSSKNTIQLMIVEVQISSNLMCWTVGDCGRRGFCLKELHKMCGHMTNTVKTVKCGDLKRDVGGERGLQRGSNR
jgi:hypothetical protein